MSGGLLSLKWNNHSSTFLGLLESLRHKESFSDATLACGGKLYPVHKFVLAICSDYFQKIFSNTPEWKQSVIVLKDISCDEVEALLSYMYVGEVNVLQDKLPGLLKAAECLQIKGLAVPDDTSDNRKDKRTTSTVDKAREAKRSHCGSVGSSFPPAKRNRRSDPTTDNRTELSNEQASAASRSLRRQPDHATDDGDDDDTVTSHLRDDSLASNSNDNRSGVGSDTDAATAGSDDRRKSSKTKPSNWNSKENSTLNVKNEESDDVRVVKQEVDDVFNEEVEDWAGEDSTQPPMLDSLHGDAAHDESVQAASGSGAAGQSGDGQGRQDQREHRLDPNSAIGSQHCYSESSSSNTLILQETSPFGNNQTLSSHMTQNLTETDLYSQKWMEGPPNRFKRKLHSEHFLEISSDTTGPGFSAPNDMEVVDCGMASVQVQDHLNRESSTENVVAYDVPFNPHLELEGSLYTEQNDPFQPPFKFASFDDFNVNQSSNLAFTREQKQEIASVCELIGPTQAARLLARKIGRHVNRSTVHNVMKRTRKYAVH